MSNRIAEIDAKMAQLKEERDRLFADERAECLKVVRDHVAKYKFTAKELGIADATSNNEFSTADIKYRNPDNQEETWGGRGKRPGWLRDKLNAGANLADFAV